MIEINKKSDIIIPFDKIGEANWEKKTRLILKSFAENWGKELPKPISPEEINQLEKRLGTTLPQSLRFFYENFGITDIGEILLDFEEIDWLKKTWEDVPQYAPDFSEKDREILPYLVAFSDGLGAGNQFCFHSETKEIIFYKHEGEPYFTKLFDTFDDYLKACLIYGQMDLFGENVEQDEVEIWVEEIITELFGKDTLKKWLY